MKNIEIIKKYKFIILIIVLIMIFIVGIKITMKNKNNIPQNNIPQNNISKNYNILIHDGSLFGYKIYYIYDDYIIAISESGGLTADGPIENKTKITYYYDSKIDLTDIIENKGEKIEDDLIIYGYGSDCIKIIGEGTYKFSAFDVLGNLLKNSTSQKTYDIK